METKFNFNSQICTTREQSELLLSLGLKKETADMYRTSSWGGDKIVGYYAPNVVLFDDHFDVEPNDLPAWSLHRLLCIIPKYIQVPDNVWKYKHDLYLSIDEELHVRYYEEGVDEPCFDKTFWGNGIYQNCIDVIEWLIKEGYFNGEYLV